METIDYLQFIIYNLRRPTFAKWMADCKGLVVTRLAVVFVIVIIKLYEKRLHFLLTK